MISFPSDFALGNERSSSRTQKNSDRLSAAEPAVKRGNGRDPRNAGGTRSDLDGKRAKRSYPRPACPMRPRVKDNRPKGLMFENIGYLYICACVIFG
jgi:hypothetical protein